METECDLPTPKEKTGKFELVARMPQIERRDSSPDQRTTQTDPVVPAKRKQPTKLFSTIQGFSVMTSDAHQYFQCDKCSNSYQEYNQMLDHIQNAHKINNHRCAEHRLSYMNRGDLITHILKVHSIECKRCHKRFLSVEYLNRHVENYRDCTIGNRTKTIHEDGEMTDAPYASDALTMMTLEIAEEGKKPVYQSQSIRPDVRYMPTDKRALQNAKELLNQRIKKEELRKKRSESPVEGKEANVSRLSNNGGHVIPEPSSFTSVPPEDAEVKVEVGDLVEDGASLSTELRLDAVEPSRAHHQLDKLQSLYRILVQQQYIQGDENAFVQDHPKYHSFQIVSTYFDEKERTFSCPECRKTVSKFALFEKHLDSHVDSHACDCGLQFTNEESLELHKEYYH